MIQGGRVWRLRFRISDVGSSLGSLVSGSGFRVSGFGSGLGSRVSGFWVSGFGFRVSGFGSGFGFWVSGFGFGGLGSGVWVCCSGFGVWGGLAVERVDVDEALLHLCRVKPFEFSVKGSGFCVSGIILRVEWLGFGAWSLAFLFGSGWGL